MLVYRLQNADWRGPYSIEHLHKDSLIDAHDDHKSHPSPHNEGLDKYVKFIRPQPEQKIWLCGFFSRKTLEVWFEGWLDRLAEVGFSVVTLKVEAKHICKGKIQLIFRKDKATLLKD